MAVAFIVWGCASDPAPSDPNATYAALTDFRSAVLAHVQEPARAQQISLIIDELQGQDRQARETVAIYRRRLAALNASYDATEDDINRLFTEFNEQHLAHQNRIVNLWTTMAGLMTDDEWDALARKRDGAATALSSRS